MYRYDEFDHALVKERIAEFTDQVGRRVDGRLTEDQFKPLRLMNGVYLQLHAYMLRVAVPYGTMNSAQMRKLGHIARVYDKGYGHFTTRTNIQYNWPALSDLPAILTELAEVEMHAIQTSGNCIRNVTTDVFAGATDEEIEDPRPWCEIIRQWSTIHPEFSFLPRKFKIAINGAPGDRAALRVHDIGLHLKKNADGELGFAVWVGGGQGRTPMLAKKIRDFLPEEHLLSYTTAIMRVYNLYGRRDNKYKARIKILVKDRTPAGFSEEVQAEWKHLKDGPSTVTAEEIERIRGRFTRPSYRKLPAGDAYVETLRAAEPAFARWLERNVHPHRVPGYACVTLSLKKPGVPPGDVTGEQMLAIADLADEYSFGELRVTHEQNLVFADVETGRLHALWQSVRALGLATPNIGLLTNIICCPGGDFCSLANAASLPVADAITSRFDDLDYLYDIGDIDVNISGCINACGHHHVGHIGILGVDKAGEEWYQITVGGRQGNDARIGRIIGRSVARHEVADVVSRLIDVYLERRDEPGERFIDVVDRLGIERAPAILERTVAVNQDGHRRVP